MLRQKEDAVQKAQFQDIMKKAKVILDNDLYEQLAKEFGDEKSGEVFINEIRDTYMELYPDTVIPPKKQKKKKKKKKKKGKTSDAATATEGLTTDTEAQTEPVAEGADVGEITEPGPSPIIPSAVDLVMREILEGVGITLPTRSQATITKKHSESLFRVVSFADRVSKQKFDSRASKIDRLISSSLAKLNQAASLGIITNFDADTEIKSTHSIGKTVSYAEDVNFGEKSKSKKSVTLPNENP